MRTKNSVKWKQLIFSSVLSKRRMRPLWLGASNNRRSQTPLVASLPNVCVAPSPQHHLHW